MITIDNISNLISAGYSVTTTWPWTHITAPRATLLVISAAIFLDVAPAGIISGITYNGRGFTKAIGHIATGTTMDAEIWYLENPTAGPNTIQVTLNGTTDDRKFGAITLLGTLSSPLNQTNSGDIYGHAASTSVTTTEAEELVIDALIAFGGTAPNCSQTSFLSDATSTILAGGSYIKKIPAGAQAMAWSWTTDGDCSQVVASFKAGNPRMQCRPLRPRIFKPCLAR